MALGRQEGTGRWLWHRSMTGGRNLSQPSALCVPLPVSWTREGAIKIAPPPSIVDPGATVRSRFIGHAAIAAIRAATGV